MRHLYRDSNVELKMYFYYTQRGAHIYLAPGGNTPAPPLVFCITVVYTTNKEGRVLFNDALNTFYLRLYGVRHMVNDQSDSERRNRLLRPHGLIFLIISKGYFI